MTVDKASGKWSRPTVLDRVYDIGVILKGFDGAVELVIGLLLWLAPGVLAGLAGMAADELASATSRFKQDLATSIGRLDHALSQGPLTFVIFFLILHGVVKLVLVYCLLKKIHWAYPYAIALLGLFLVYQLYALVTRPTVWMLVFTLLDAAIIYLVYREYREIRAQAARAQAAKAQVANTDADTPDEG